MSSNGPEPCFQHTGRGRIKLVAGSPDILETSPSGQRAAARSVLSGKGVSVITGGMVQPLGSCSCMDHHVALTLPAAWAHCCRSVGARVLCVVPEQSC
jgi:hypothetical protein